MAIKSLAKADSLIRNLAEALRKRTANAGAGRLDTVQELRDSDGNPYILMTDGGTATAGNPVVLVRIKQIDAVSKDVFGNSMSAYTPHVCEYAYELDGANAEPLPADQALVMFELSKLGVEVQVKQIADGTAVTPANVDAAAAALELDWLQWPTKGM